MATGWIDELIDETEKKSELEAQKLKAELLRKRIEKNMALGDTEEEIVYQDEQDIAGGRTKGRATHQKMDRFGSRNLIGSPVAWGLNKLFKTGDKEQGRIDTATQGLQRAREIERGKSERERTNTARETVFKRMQEEQMQKNVFGQQDTQQENLFGQQNKLQTGRNTQETSERKADERFTRGTGAQEFFWDGQDSGTVRTFTNRNGRYFSRTDQGEVEVFPDQERLVPYKAPTTGSRNQVRQQKYDEGLFLQDASITPYVENFKQLFGSTKTELQDATGVLDEYRFLTEKGLFPQDDPRFNKLAELQGTMDRLSYQGMAPMLEVLTGSKSDKDVELAMGTGPTLLDNPPVWLNNFEMNVIPMIMMKARQAKIRTPEEINELENELTKIAKAAAKRHSVDEERDPTLIRGVNSIKQIN